MIFCHLEGFPIGEFFPMGETFGIAFFIDNILTPAIQLFQAAHRGKGRTLLHLPLENCKVHNSQRAQACYDENSVVRILHPPDFSDRSTSYCYLFAKVKDWRKTKSFDEVKQLLERIHEILDSILRNELITFSRTGSNVRNI
jgi:hypothetical protein